MLNVDWFRPHKHSPGSVGVLYLVLLSLPRHEWYKLENIIVVGILPGPSEPTPFANTFLEHLFGSCRHSGPATNASPFMVVYLNAQSVLFVFHRISQLQGKLEDSLVTWLLKVVPVLSGILIQEMALISVDLTETIGSQETLPQINGTLEGTSPTGTTKTLF